MIVSVHLQKIEKHSYSYSSDHLRSVCSVVQLATDFISVAHCASRMCFRFDFDTWEEL